jgi:hypothetical protein
MNSTNPDDINRALFTNLVISLAQSALIGLGKILNPATQKTAVNLDAAQQAIDMLDMLEAKTRGNLDADEDKMLKQTLSMLKLNYVETANVAPTPAADAAPQADKPAEEDKVRFRKKYD